LKLKYAPQEKQDVEYLTISHLIEGEYLTLVLHVILMTIINIMQSTYNFNGFKKNKNNYHNTMFEGKLEKIRT
jgi:hypothetical protein